MSKTDLPLGIDFSKLTPIEHMFGDDFEETQQLAALFEEAELYLASFAGCEAIKRAYFGLGVSDFIGIFLFEFLPKDESKERFLWVVTGDVPSACLAADTCPDPTSALRAYIEHARGMCNVRSVTLLETVVLKHYTQDSA
ncbi:hypothetical protein [Pseudoduganella sp. OTU4001]|uniref:hypothetical protein n=1 Tax=Pseudoduganella sp. OTU4001 TaxID=3043854 RepID=UPI00313B9AD4